MSYFTVYRVGFSPLPLLTILPCYTTSIMPPPSTWTPPPRMDACGAWQPSSGYLWQRFSPSLSASGAQRHILFCRPQWVVSRHHATKTPRWQVCHLLLLIFLRQDIQGLAASLLCGYPRSLGLFCRQRAQPPPAPRDVGHGGLFLLAIRGCRALSLWPAATFSFPCTTTCGARRPSSCRQRSCGPLPWPA